MFLICSRGFKLDGEVHSVVLARESLNGAVFTEQGEEQKFVM